MKINIRVEKLFSKHMKVSEQVSDAGYVFDWYPLALHMFTLCKSNVWPSLRQSAYVFFVSGGRREGVQHGFRDFDSHLK